jgi:hypothetical protein
MGISTQGSTSISLNTAAVFTGASPQSLGTVGGITYPRYPTSSPISENTMLGSTSLFTTNLQSSNTSYGTVSITYPFSVSGQGSGTGYAVISKVYSYMTIVATSIYPHVFQYWSVSGAGGTHILTTGTTTGANQPYGTAASPIVYTYNLTTTDASNYTTIIAVFV